MKTLEAYLGGQILLHWLPLKHVAIHKDPHPDLGNYISAWST